MCTAISVNKGRHLFGRTLDVDCSYGEKIIVTPLGYQFKFLFEKVAKKHSALLGTGITVENYPLYFDAVNQYGLAGAGLNFPKYGVYNKAENNKYNVASFELIPWVLSVCHSLEEVRSLLSRTNIVSNPFSETMPVTPLHWMFSDKSGSVVVESSDGVLKVFDNTYGVLTNSPPFEEQLSNLSYYMQLDSFQPKNKLLCEKIIEYQSNGMGAIGLPGDFSSRSRFVRAVFVKNHTVIDDENDDVSSFFDIMDTLKIPRGCVRNSEGREHYTVYTSCIDTEKFVYHYTTFGHRFIKFISPLEFVDLKSKNLCTIEM